MEKEIKDWIVGDILYYEYGYERTNVAFYKIVKRTEKTFTLVEVESKVVSGDPMRQYYTAPADSLKEIGEPVIARVCKYGVRFPGARIGIYYYNGKPRFADTGYYYTGI